MVCGVKEKLKIRGKEVPIYYELCFTDAGKPAKEVPSGHSCSDRKAAIKNAEKRAAAERKAGK